jgi:hypothetical protein
MKNFAALLAALPLAGCISLADAGALVDVSVLDRSSGQELEVYRHRGRLYVAGSPAIVTPWSCATRVPAAS